MSENRFDHWRKCWEAYLLGSQENTEGVYEKAAIASIDRMADQELDFRGYADDSEVLFYSRIFPLRARAMAFRTKDSKYFGNKEYARQILKDLDAYCAKHYNMNLGPDSRENWWGFEIGMPLRLLDILVLLYDELDDPEAEIKKYTDIILFFKDAYKASARGRDETGANLMWKCHVILLTGILRQDQALIDWANEKIETTLRYVHPMTLPGIGQVYEDGFYEDGSFIQHYMFAYTGGYGKHFLSILCGLIYAFRGEECLTLSKEKRDFFFERLKDTYLPLLYKGHMMDVCRGREPSRYWAEDDAIGAVVLRALLYLREALPEGQKQELTALLKEQLSEEKTRMKLFYDFHPSAEYFVTPSLAERLRSLDAANVPSAAPLHAHYNFGAMVKPVHRTENYALAISMYSKNIACYEKLNGESGKFWHMSDGVTYLYTGSGDAYNGDFYATVDMQRLPGTTIERSANRAADPYFNWYLPEARNTYAFAGGATLGKAGIAGMQYRGQGNGKERTLEVKKSWFMFDKEVVCLGSGISTTTDNQVETIVLNDRLLSKDLRFRVLTGDGELDLAEGEEKVVKTDRLYVEQAGRDGSESKRAVGYVFPSGCELHILMEQRLGTWNQVEINPNHVSENDFLTVWISHGTHPESASYAYAILPAASEAEWKEAADKPVFEIVENSESAHAVRHFGEQLLGINFWKEEPYTCAGVSASTQASVLIDESQGQAGCAETAAVRIAVADPTKQDRTIELCVCGKTYTADTKGLEGRSVLLG